MPTSPSSILLHETCHSTGTGLGRYTAVCSRKEEPVQITLSILLVALPSIRRNLSLATSQRSWPHVSIKISLYGKEADKQRQGFFLWWCLNYDSRPLATALNAKGLPYFSLCTGIWLIHVFLYNFVPLLLLRLFPPRVPYNVFLHPLNCGTLFLMRWN